MRPPEKDTDEISNWAVTLRPVFQKVWDLEGYSVWIFRQR